MRESDWLVAGFSIVVFAVATTQARNVPIDAAPVVLDLRAGASERVVLPLRLAPEVMPVVMSSLPAVDESTLFGIEVEPRVAEVAPADLAPPPEVTEAPRRRVASPRRERRLASVSRHTAGAAVVAVPDAPVGKPGLAVVELDAPTRRPRSAIALAPDGSVSTAASASLGFRLNERTSLNVGPLSSMVPSYAPDAGHGDLNERWRLHDEDNAAQAPGAAVGMTFKLN